MQVVEMNLGNNKWEVTVFLGVAVGVGDVAHSLINVN